MIRDPEACANMDELRAEIDRIDRELVALLARRAACIDRAVVLKRAADMPARIDERVEDVIAKVRAAAEANRLSPALAEALWRRLIEWSIGREERALGDTRG